MSKINAIQNAIKELEGGRFQKLFDAYLFKKYGFSNIQSLGVQDGTDKTTKGTPDSYIINADGTYTLIMYGTVGTKAFEKLKEDILSCLEYEKVGIGVDKIEKIICAYSNTNINVGQMEALRNLVSGDKVVLIGIDTMSYDLLVHYPFFAEEFLNMPIGTSQIYDIKDFVEVYDRNGMNSPLNMSFIARNKEKEELYANINLNPVTLVIGASGIGKTRLIIEVCKRFEFEGWKVLCVKNNGSYLLDDIKYYINDTGKYLLFIDDANQTTSLEAVFSYISEASEKIEIKIVMSVRDYAKERIGITLSKYCNPVVQNIIALGNDEIKEMLKENFNIFNSTYLERITSIAKGNARLAVLAGRVSKEKGYLAISNVMDIFYNYYGRILQDLTLSEDIVNVLFIISLLRRIKFKEDVAARKLLEVFDIDEKKFNSFCFELNDKELVDLYCNEVVQISDQSFGDFILYYVLISKKNISIEQLLDAGFPDFKNRIIYALNTIINLFDSKETRKYIEQQVKNMLDKVSPDLQWEYLKSFHALSQEKTLSVLKQRIDMVETIDFNLDAYDFEKEKNNKSIKSEEIEVLCDFKYTDYCEDAVDLLLLYYNRRPDMVVEFYNAFTDKLGYDIYSYDSQYEKELKVIQRLWENAEEGTNKNITFLLVKVFGYYLGCWFHKAELENNKTIKTYHLNVLLVDGSKRLHRFIWCALAKVYAKGLYIELINNILSEHHVNFTNKEEARKIFKYDYDNIKEFFFGEWDNISFEQCKVLKSIEKNFYWLGLEPDVFVEKYKENKEYAIYDVFQEVHDPNMDWKEEQAARKDRIERFVSDYALDDYRNLFLLCKKFEVANDEEGYHIANGIAIIFNSLKNNISYLLKVVYVYLEHNAPYGRNMGQIIQFLIENIGANSVIELIEKYEFDYKNLWLCDYYSFISVEDINDAVVKKFSEYVHSQSFQDIPAIPSIEYLMKYKKMDRLITDKASNIVLEKSVVDPHIVTTYLGWSAEKNIDIILDFFDGDLNVLEDLYLIAFRKHYDYNGKLFLKIMESDDGFWNKFIRNIADDRHKTMYEVNIFEYIWSRDDYESKISVAVEQMIGDAFWLGKENAAEIIFCNKENTPEEIRTRKKMWIKRYIALNFSDEQKMITVFNIISTVLQSYREEFILEITRYRKDIDFFRKIPLFPICDSWTGSEVPLIDKKIEFLNGLIVVLKGFVFIEHRDYLNDIKEGYERYKADVLIREYMRDMDII